MNKNVYHTDFKNIYIFIKWKISIFTCFQILCSKQKSAAVCCCLLLEAHCGNIHPYLYSHLSTSCFFKLINIDNSCIPIKKYSLTCRDKSWYPNTCWGWNNKTWQWEQWEKSGIYWLTIADYSRGTANNSGEWQIRDYHPRKHGEIL